MSFKDLLFAILVTFVWGLNYIFVKIGVATIPPLFFCALKFSVCSLLVVLFKFKTQLKWSLIAKLGLVLGTLTFSFLYLGIQLGVPSGIASLLMQAQMIFTILLSVLLLKDQCSWMEALGIGIAFLGVFGITQHPDSQAINGFGVALILCAAFAGGLSNIIVKKAGSIDNFELIVWMSLIPPIPLFALSYLVEENQINSILSLDFKGGFSILYGSVISTVFGYGLWGKLLKKYSPTTVAPFLLLVPIFGIISSYLILDEKLAPAQLFAAVIVIVGLLITMLGNRSKLKSNSEPKQDLIFPSEIRMARSSRG